MARIEHPWKCDGCPATKQPSNNWLIAYELPDTFRPKEAKGVTVVEWDETEASIEGRKHFCGIECVQKFIAQVIQRIYSKPPLPTTADPEHPFPGNITRSKERAQ